MPQRNFACFMDQRVTQRSSPPNTRNEIRVPTRGIRTRAGRNVPEWTREWKKRKPSCNAPHRCGSQRIEPMINGLVIAKMTTGTEIKITQMTKAMMIL